MALCFNYPHIITPLHSSLNGTAWRSWQPFSLACCLGLSVVDLSLSVTSQDNTNHYARGFDRMQSCIIRSWTRFCTVYQLCRVYFWPFLSSFFCCADRKTEWQTVERRRWWSVERREQPKRQETNSACDDGALTWLILSRQDPLINLSHLACSYHY